MAVILSSVFCALNVLAQESLSEKLNVIITNNDWDNGIKLYEELKESDLLNLSDNVQFDYHYLGAFLNSDNFTDNPDHEKAISHLKEAKRLCETSLGTYFSGYMEVMGGLGDEYFALKQYEDALNSYQEGIVKSMAIRLNHPQLFANLIMGVQECYERLGQFNEVPKNLLDAWEFWTKDAEPYEYSNYFPLSRLLHFYLRYEKSEKALQVSDMILAFLSEKVGEEHPLNANELYFRGVIFSGMKEYNKAIDAYKKGIQILKINKLTQEESFLSFLGNLVDVLIDAGYYDEASITLNEIKKYGIINNNPDIYKNAIFMTSKKYNDNRDYQKAIDFIENGLRLNLTEKEKEIFENQKEKIIYNKKVIDKESDLSALFNSLNQDSKEWFETCHQLSSVYYLKKDYTNNFDILMKMYKAIKKGYSSGEEYFYWVLDNLYGLEMDRGNFNEALNYAKEKEDDLKKYSDIPDDYYLRVLNALIVAKLKSNNLEGIENDLEKNKILTKKLYGEDSYNYGIYLHNQGRALQLQGKLEEALQTYLMSLNTQIDAVGKAENKTVSYIMEVKEQITNEELDL